MRFVVETVARGNHHWEDASLHHEREEATQEASRLLMSDTSLKRVRVVDTFSEEEVWSGY